MFIASVELETENKARYRYKIITDKSKEDYECEPALVHYEAEIANEMMKAYTNNQEYFQCDNQRFKIISFYCNSLFNVYNKHKRRKCDFSNKAALIHIYKQNALCPRCKRHKKKSNLENVIASVSCLLNRSDTCDIEIQYCRNCKEYFVDEQSLAEYEKKYGLLLFERSKEFSKNGWTDNDYDYNPDSILSRYGYSAQTDIITEKARRAVLIYLIEKGYKNHIKNLLSSFIKNRGNRCYKACPVWMSDLDFVNEYSSEYDRYIGYGQLKY